MHEEFCMISDRPLFIKVDEQNRPHCDDGPFTAWRDGSKLYSIHGVRVPGKYCETPAHEIDPREVLAEDNADIRMAVIKKCGFAHFLKHLNAETISEENGNKLIEFSISENMLVRALHLKWTDKISEKETVLPVPRTEEEYRETGGYIPSDINSCEQVRLWTTYGGNFLKET